MIDIEHAHDILRRREDGKLYASRMAGKTTLRILELLGAVETSEADVICCLVTSFNDVDYLIPMILSAAEQLELPIQLNKDRSITLNGKAVYFVPEDYFDRWQTFRDFSLIYMRHTD